MRLFVPGVPMYIYPRQSQEKAMPMGMGAAGIDGRITVAFYIFVNIREKKELKAQLRGVTDRYQLVNRVVVTFPI